MKPQIGLLMSVVQASAMAFTSARSPGGGHAVPAFASIFVHFCVNRASHFAEAMKGLS